MIIELKIGKEIKRIKKDKFSYMPLNDRGEPYRYFKRLGGAVEHFVRTNLVDDNKAVELREYVKIYNESVKKILKMESVDDFNVENSLEDIETRDEDIL